MLSLSMCLCFYIDFYASHGSLESISHTGFFNEDFIPGVVSMDVNSVPVGFCSTVSIHLYSLCLMVALTGISVPPVAHVVTEIPFTQVSSYLLREGLSV